MGRKKERKNRVAPAGRALLCTGSCRGGVVGRGALQEVASRNDASNNSSCILRSLLRCRTGLLHVSEAAVVSCRAVFLVMSRLLCACLQMPIAGSA